MQKNNNREILEKNFKLMSISATVLVVLFAYTFFKSDTQIEGNSYYIGLAFLLVLMFFAFFMKFFKNKLLDKLPKSNFANELVKVSQNEDSTNKNESIENSSIEAVQSNITFKDIAGIDGAKAELEEVVDFLNNPKKYTKHNIKLPKGVLLVGPPGVGKTLIARAVAGEASVPFFYQSGASFVHIYVGMGAKRVRELFIKAKANAPSIIFIDEIDAIGKQRGANSNDEREATLNELLTQMDGFEGDSGVIVIAATNKIEVLDDALLRAGRFDRRVFLSLPNINDREKILNLYLKKCSYSFDVKELASQTIGFSSAALATLVNEALLNMVKRDSAILEILDIENAKYKIEFGKKDKMVLTNSQKELIAIYQSSKSFISKNEIKLFENELKDENIEYLSKSEIVSIIKKHLAGSIGVEIIKGESYAINADEIKLAENIAKSLVDKYRVSNDYEALLMKIKNDLRSEISKNVDNIENLKNTILEKEILTKEDIAKYE